jgi:hypothetical protein
MCPEVRWYARLWIAAVIFAIVAGLTVFMSGQQGGRLADPSSSLHDSILTSGPEGPVELKGLPDDWSHHHLVFSNPGTEEDASRDGRYDEWLRIVNDPRYIMQQLKRRSPAQGPAADYVAKMNELGRVREAPGSVDLAEGRLQDPLRLVKDPRPIRPVKAEIHRDWSMNMGGAGASQIGTVSGTPTAAQGQTITINGSLVLTATPTAATATGTFTGNPTNGQTATIGGLEVLTASLGAPATGSITVGSSFCFANGQGVNVNGAALTTNATAGTGSFTVATVPAAGETVVIGGVTYTFETTLSGSTANQVLVPGTNNSTNRTDTAENLAVALNDTGTCGYGSPCTRNVTAANPEVSSTNTPSATQTLTALCADNSAITLTADGTKVTVSNVAVGGAGTTSGTNFALNATGTTPASQTVTAANIITAVNANSTTVTASANGTGVVKLTANTWGTAGNSYTLTDTATSGVTLATFSGGAVGTNTGTDFAIDNVLADAATNLAAAITRNGGTVGVTATSNGAVVTVTATTAGSGGNSITLAEGLSNFSWSGSDLSGGLALTQGGLDFETSSTPATEAGNIAQAINVSGNGSSVGVTATANSQVAGQVIVSDTTVNEGNTITVAETVSNFAWSGSGTLVGENAAVASVIGGGVFPAKYSFSTTGAPTCNDFVAYTTGLAGSSTVPSIIAYNNIYSGASPGCGATGTPTVYWEYNTGGTIGTNPVISWDGTQLAFIQTEGTAAYLTILRYSASGATISGPTSETPANYPGCTAPCMTSIEFDGDANDTNSSPFYNYSTDTLYVGDAAGKLHQFTGVFKGTPAENTTSPWPVTVSTGNALTSPVYDSNSGLVFVGNGGSAGYLYSVTTSGSTKVQSYQLAESPGLVEGPLVDSVTEKVYAFVQVDTNSNTGDSCAVATGCNGVYQLPATFTSTTSWNESVMGVGTTEPVFAGAFDNQYYTSEGTSNTTPTGNLYVCGTYGGSSNEPKLMDAIITTGAFTSESGEGSKGSSDGHGTVYFATNIAKPMTSAAASCSPVTEIYNANASTPTDWIFMSVTGSGSLTGCTGACIYSWNTTSTLAFEGTGTTITQPTQTLQVTGGTGGIIVDNISTQTGASQIYFGLLGSATCTGNGNGPGLGAGGCAVQAAQSGLQ